MHTTMMRWFILLICLGFISSTRLLAETEPNNTPATAVPIAPNGASTGSLDYYSAPADVVDWWAVTTTTDGRLYVETNSQSSVDIDLFLYDADGVTELASYDISTGTKESTHCNNLSPGTYYIRASNANSGVGTYTIQCTFTSAGLANDPEVNDSASVASRMNLNSSATGHIGYYHNGYTDLVDWWKVTTTFDGSLVVNTVSDPTFDLDLFLYDQDGQTQIASYDTSIGIHEATHFKNLTPGTYYIKAVRIGSSIDDRQGSYTISNVFTPTGLANDVEPNDAVLDASTLAVNDSATGHLGYYRQGVCDVNDWWRISLPKDGPLTIRTYSDGTLDVDLFLYDVDGTTQIASYDTSVGRNEATHYNALKAGTYFVRAYCAGSFYGSYRISSHFTAAALANDVEPNDSRASARPISLNSRAEGHIGFFGNGTLDVEDFYAFTLPALWDTLFVRTDSDPTVDIDLIMYNAAGTQIASAGNVGTMELLRLPAAAAGSYSVQLIGYYGTASDRYGSYAVVVSNVRPTTPLVDVQEAEQKSDLPKMFALAQNYPNPFNPSTTIEFEVPGGSPQVVSLRIFDMLGREVATLVNGQKSAGYYHIKWNAQNTASGIYFYQLKAGSFVQTKKMLVVK